MRVLVCIATLLVSSGSALGDGPSFEGENYLGSKGYASGTTRVPAVDLDGDGDVDVVVANRDMIRWYENKKNSGTFKERMIDEGSYREFSDLEIVDLDGDGDLDVVASGYQQQDFDKTGGLIWLENVGKARAWKRHEIDAKATGLRGIAVGDFDGDSDLDVATGGMTGVSWYENAGKAATWGARSVITSDDKEMAWDVDAGDLDGDGDADLAVGGQSHLFGWISREGDGWGALKPLLKDTKLARQVHVVDVDGDGDQDIVGCAVTTNQVVVFTNADGKGTFGADVVSAELYAPGSLALADMDGDGDIDILVAPYDHPSELAYFANDDGDFDDKVTVLSTKASRDTFIGVSVGDLDGDGDVDIVVGSYANASVYWIKNTTK